MGGFFDNIRQRLGDFASQDMLRRTNNAGDPRHAAMEDRRREGALISSLLGPAAPIATVPVGLAGAGYEGVKGLGQATGLGKYFPGPFKTDETSSPADFENVISLLRGYTER